ncbi:MAG: DUF4405 domain-containing protein [Sedimentisphaerales bacterium]|nr:DUF4405 domain-containing protein [Sedimentisphaerales bacterium]
METERKKIFSWHAFFSVLAGLSFIGMVFTGVILFVVPPGRIANWTGWRLIGLTKDQWIGLHDWFSIIFIVASVFHIYLNWKPLVSYFKGKVSRAFALRFEWVLSLVICAVIFFGTLGNVRPFSSLLAWNENIKQGWEDPRRQAPIPHAELLTLKELSEQVSGMELETIIANLKAKGIEVKSSDVVLGELAESHNMTPSHLYDIAVGRTSPGRGQGQGRQGQGQGQGQRGQYGGGGSGRGFGQMTLKEYCDSAGMEVDKAVQKLKEAGFTARPEITIRNIADSKGAHPSEIRTILSP